MKTFYSFTLAILAQIAYGQLSPEPLQIRFLETTPIIDGSLDSNLNTLPVNSFRFADTGDSGTTAPKASFRMAYGAGFFYVYAEVLTDSLVYRDRGYQNGDGMILILAKPAPSGEPSSEFYAMGFTALPEGVSNWQQKFVWYRNVDLAMTRLRDSRFAARQGVHVISMECLVPWEEVYPFHPWLSEGIGCNLAVVKARGTHDKIIYYLERDEDIGSEQRPRKYVNIFFDPPKVTSGVQSYAVLEENNIREGGELNFRLATCSAENKAGTTRLILYSGEHTRVTGGSWSRLDTVGERITEIELSCAGLLPGGYQAEWSADPSNPGGKLYFTILPSYSAEALSQELEARKSTLSPGSYNTLKFRLQEATLSLRDLKPYETAYEERVNLEHLNRLIHADQDLIAQEKGSLRRAFLSAVDGTYRPYSVKIPDTLIPGNKYPLVVYLHGSGQDDQGVLDFVPDPGIPVIFLAPNGRGTSNCYSADHAQEDIQEALEDVIRNYPVDTSRIILTGFSMGGYGVLRTFYEHPKEYKALAIFSGGPDLAVRWIGPDQPDFLKDQFLTPFGGEEIFIFHGTKDQNLSIEKTQMMVQKLKQAGAKVTYTEEPVGHEGPGPDTVRKYQDWVRAVLH